MKTHVLVALVALPLLARPVAAEPWDQGKLRIGPVLGAGGIGGEWSFILGASVGYFVVDGLELALQYDHWFSEPAVDRVGPKVRYIFGNVPWNPYVGAFYRHWFYGPADIDSLGARLGIVLPWSDMVFFEIGAAFEGLVSGCTANCFNVSPEASISATF